VRVYEELEGGVVVVQSPLGVCRVGHNARVAQIQKIEELGEEIRDFMIPSCAQVK
jgi:hypothetical protein